MDTIKQSQFISIQPMKKNMSQSCEAEEQKNQTMLAVCPFQLLISEKKEFLSAVMYM